MQSKLSIHISEYKKITLEQKNAIEEQNIDLLDKLILDKNSIIGKITSYLNSGEKLDYKTQETVKEIMSIEKNNMKHLKIDQQKIRKEIDRIKKRQRGLNSYRENSLENFYDKKSLKL